MTDAGRATEWAEFMDAVDQHPVLAARMIVLPGNHDLNIVDRQNPAQLDLPFSPGKRLRQMRALSAIAAVQGHRVLVVDPASGKFGRTLAQALAPHRQRIADFADTGSLRLSAGLGRLWDEQFPMILPPAAKDGLGVAILNTNAETHFSFTNALGVISAEQTQARSGDQPIPESPLDRRAASPSRGVSDVSCEFIRAHRNRVDQRELVCPQTETFRCPNDRHARPSPYRLDRRMW